MIRIGSIEARPGERGFGYLEVARSRSGLRPDVPVHVLAGARPGPTLLVQAAIHGNEIIGTIAILNVIRRLDPRSISGTLIAVPVVNRLGFDQQARVSPIDGKDILRLFPGNPNGSISDQIAYAYFENVIKRADVMIDFHAGGRTAYERYVCFAADRQAGRPSELEQLRHKLVVAFGLDTAAYFPHGIFTGSETEDAIEREGVVLFTPELGGGTGWLKNGKSNVGDAERGILNTMKVMGMLDGEMETDGPLCTIYNACVVLWKPPVDGLFMRKRGFGEQLRVGDVYGVLQDPYTGEELAAIPNTQDATVIPSGQEWLTVGSTSIGILGVVDRIVDRRSTDLRCSFG